jgi:site-specific DNA recombinase
MQLASLAPDITEAILGGRQPPNMTLDTLISDIPADWVEQREQMLRLTPLN